MHVKKGDKVKIIAGKDKGKTGVIERAFPQERKVLIEGVNIAKRSLRGPRGKTGQIVERPMPIDASNVMRIEK
jgi:large subunit ribosomal protein L24